MKERREILRSSRWMSELLEKMPQEEQINWLTEKLTDPSIEKKIGLDVLEGLAVVIDDNIAFREHLRKDVYLKLYQSGSSKLAAAVAKKILGGWDWQHSKSLLLDPMERYADYERIIVNIDAKDCFQFFCSIYDLADEERKGFLVDALHDHVNTRKEEHDGWEPEDLNEWILYESVPGYIATVLAGVRSRLGGGGLIRRETFLSRAFQTQARSSEAVNLLAEQMRATRQAEELAHGLMLKIGLQNCRGDFNPRLEVPEYPGKVEWKLENVGTIRVTVTFHRSSNSERAKNNSNAFPRVISEMQAVRDRLLDKVKNPPQILFEAYEMDVCKNRPPDGFSYIEKG